MVTLREVEKAIVKAWGVLLCLPEPQALLELGKAARPSKTWSLAVVQGGKWSWFMYVSVCTCVRVLHVYTCVPVCVTCVCVTCVCVTCECVSPVCLCVCYLCVTCVCAFPAQAAVLLLPFPDPQD